MSWTDDDSTTEPLTAASRDLQRCIVVLAEGSTQTHILPERGKLVIGRGQNVDVRIDHPSVSREHAELHIDPGLSIRDLSSVNGTRVVQRDVAPGESTDVFLGDVIELGHVALIIQDVAATGAAPAVPPPPGMIVESPPMREVISVAQRVANSSLSVLLQGETGAGKEVIAEHIHKRSRRAAKRLVKLNCAALPDNLLESELFGYEKGAFTGATQSKVGLLEAADGGTAFLDEIGDMPLALQTKLLRVLEVKKLMRVGGVDERSVDVRIVSATHRDIAAACEAGEFRSDLYYRLNGITITIPPLRERPEDIAPLAGLFIKRAAAEQERSPPTLDRGALAHLQGYGWPGNVRELKNVLERAVVLCESQRITEADLTLDAATARSLEPPDDEEAQIRDALAKAAGNQSQAARILGVSRSTLIRRLEHYGIKRPQKDRS